LESVSTRSRSPGSIVPASIGFIGPSIERVFSRGLQRSPKAHVDLIGIIAAQITMHGIAVFRDGRRQSSAAQRQPIPLGHHGTLECAFQHALAQITGL
jgi:hypothetical protein